MDYEKKYKQLHEFITDLYPHMSEYCKEKVEGFFSELTESEDERIRKWCISHFKAAIRGTKDNAEYQEHLNNKVIPWLEKQGEQKPTADDKKLKKIEKQDTPKDYNSIDPHFGKPIETNPKFKIGDWVATNTDGFRSPLKIMDVLDMEYRIEDSNGNSGIPKIDYLDGHYHLWTTEDAKDGDVLARNNDMLSICIFAHFSGINNRYDSFLCHCGLEGEGLGQVLSINGYHDDCRGYVPATKEQRELIFAKMKEAGYEWDASQPPTNEFAGLS